MNSIPNALALVEPMDVAALWRAPSVNSRIGFIEGFFREQRTNILQSKRALARVTSGLFDDNTFDNEPNAEGFRGASLSLATVKVEKHLDDDFTLVVKHPNAFTAILHEVVDRISCFAVIRNPVSVLASWNTLAIPLRNGRAPAAENLDTLLQNDLERCNGRYERQVRLIDWYFRQYATLLPPERVIRYEQIIETGGDALKVIDPAARFLNERLDNQNGSSLYEPDVISEVSAALRAYGSAWKMFYPDL